MSFVIIFALGYAVGGASALLILGLTLASRNESAARHGMEMISRDAERYSH
ncbi:MAG TPA: hypothetical protein VF897_16075 [Roseiflexaceae bacterium]